MTTTATALTISARAKAEIFAIVIAIAIGAYGFHTWLAEHDARIRAQDQVSAAQKSFDQASEQLKQSQQAQAAKDAATQATIAKLADDAAEQKTPQQITKWIPTQLGSLPAPIKTTPAPASNPAAPVVYEVPQVDLDFLKNDIATCQQQAVALAGAKADVTSCQAQQKILNGQINDLEKQRDALQAELKGGTFWQRVKHDAKIVGVGAAIGAAAALAARR